MKRSLLSLLIALVSPGLLSCGGASGEDSADGASAEPAETEAETDTSAQPSGGLFEGLRASRSFPLPEPGVLHTCETEVPTLGQTFTGWGSTFLAMRGTDPAVGGVQNATTDD